MLAHLCVAQALGQRPQVRLVHPPPRHTTCTRRALVTRGGMGTGTGMGMGMGMATAKATGTGRRDRTGATAPRAYASAPDPLVRRSSPTLTLMDHPLSVRVQLFSATVRAVTASQYHLIKRQ